MKLHHIGIIVEDLDSVINKYRDIFNVKVSKKMLMEKYNVKIALVEFENIQLEFIQPVTKEGEYFSFLQQQGGLHHLAVEVEDIDVTIDHLTDKKITMQDKAAKAGANNSLVAFSDKISFDGVIFEFKQFINR